MNFISTRDASEPASLSAAIAAGLAPDGGLYVPMRLPASRTLRAGANLADTATGLLAPFFEGDALEPELPAICREAFDFPAPLKPLATPGDASAHARVANHPALVRAMALFRADRPGWATREWNHALAQFDDAQRRIAVGRLGRPDAEPRSRCPPRVVQ